MYIHIPVPSTIAATLESGDAFRLLAESDDGSPKSGWHSIIGIVTAICGNILISFALNTQRYAHIRLSREHDEQQEKQKHDKAHNGHKQSYGTAQEQLAEVRLRKNLDVHYKAKQSKTNGTGNNEAEPLLDGGNERGNRSADSEEEEQDESRPQEKSYLKSPWWWLGISLMVVGEGGNFLAYGFAPASIVSPLGVVALVVNCLIAPLMLHERFRWRDGLGVVIAVAGCVTVVLSASGSNPKLDADQIWELISTWEFKTYFGITVFLIVVLMAASNKYGDRSILIDLGLVGLFGGYTALSTKGVASLLSNTIWRIVTFPITYLLIAILVVTAIMQIKYVNRALQRFDSTQVIPTQFVMFTISVIIGSAVLYRDFERQSAQDAVKFFAGCALTFLGVWFITSGRAKEVDSDEEEEDEESEEIHLVDEERQLPEIQEQDEEPQRPVSEPITPRLQHETSQPTTPLFKFTRHEDDMLDEPSPFTENPWSAPNPASASAIHADLAELPARRNQLPPMHATTSAPVLPTMSTAGERPRVQTRATGPASPSAYRPRTPDQQQQTLEPQTPSTPLFGSVGRHSIAGLLPEPGPLTNPLSGSLSAIVIDSLRRGVDVIPGTGTLKRRTLRSKRSTRLNVPQLLTTRHSVTEGADYSRSPRRGVSESLASSPQPTSADPGSRGRGRSFSATLGDLIRAGKGRRRDSLEGGGGGDQDRQQ